MSGKMLMHMTSAWIGLLLVNNSPGRLVMSRQGWALARGPLPLEGKGLGVPVACERKESVLLPDKSSTSRFATSTT